MKILIVTWGDPYTWQEVQYKYNNELVKSSTSLKILIEKIKPDKTIIIGLDSVIDRVLFQFPSFKTYLEIENKAKDYYESFINNWLLKVDKIIIGFGKGEFPKSKFEGNALDFYNKVIYELSKIILESIDSSEVKIYLDITHGLNFMPVLGYRIVRELAQILAYFYEVKFVVLNADPYVRDASSVLNINEILNVKIRPQFFVYKPERRPLEPYYGLEEKEKEKMGEKIKLEWGRFKDNSYCFASAVIYGLPYYVYYFFPGIPAMQEFMGKICESYLNCIKITNPSKRLTILRRLQFQKEFAELVKILFIVKLMEVKGKVSNKIEVSLLSEIKNLKGLIWQKFPVESNRIDVEIVEINGLQNIPNDWKVYAEVKGLSCQNQIDKRNFFAHAGFEYNSIMIRKQEQNIFIKIKSELENNVKKYLMDNLPKGE